MLEPAHLSRRTIAAALPLAAITGAVPAASAAVPAIVAADSVLAQIERHKALRLHVNNTPWPDDGPLYLAACAEEEAAIQALGDMMPTTLFGAIAQLEYMVEVEEAFADDQSPLVRCVLTVAKALAGGLPT